MYEHRVVGRGVDACMNTVYLVEGCMRYEYRVVGAYVSDEPTHWTTSYPSMQSVSSLPPLNATRGTPEVIRPLHSSSLLHVFLALIGSQYLPRSRNTRSEIYTTEGRYGGICDILCSGV